MVTKVYLQSTDGLPDFQHSYDLLTSIKQARWRNPDENIEVFFVESVDSIDELGIFSGSVEFVEKAFNKFGFIFPQSLTVKLLLTPYILLCRKVWSGYKKDFQVGLFAKPLMKTKAFTGGVYTSKFMFDFDMQSVSDDLDILYSEPIEIVSEYRCWVFRNKVIDIRMYVGDWKVYPSSWAVDKTVEEMSKEMPIAYTVDFGVTDKGETVVIEYNDIFATGTYGFDGVELYQLTKKRFSEYFNKIL